MANYAQIKRWEIILSLVRRYRFITKKNLANLLADEYEIYPALRTIERDFAKIKIELGIEILYCPLERGYYIVEENEGQLVEFLQYAGRIFLGELFKENLKNFKQLKDKIKPEEYSFYEGLEHIQPLLLAVRNQLEIRFIHESFQRNTNTPYQITPLQLREYDRRWYVVGVPVGEAHIKTFGLSRISKLKTLQLSTLDPKKFLAQLEKFNRIVGLNYDAADDAYIIKIAVTPEQYKYLKTLPLHPSQTLMDSLSDGRVVLSLYLIPNYELKMQFLKMGDQIEVLEPAFLRKEIKEILQNSIKRYSD